MVLLLLECLVGQLGFFVCFSFFGVCSTLAGSSKIELLGNGK